MRTGLLYALGIAAGIHLLWLVLTKLLQKPLGLDAIERATAIYSNAGALVYPLAVLVILWAVGAAGWIPGGKSVLMTVFLATITPACATITSMAQLYDCDVKKSSSLYVLSTLLSLVTMPIMLGLFDTLL